MRDGTAARGEAPGSSRKELLRPTQTLRFSQTTRNPFVTLETGMLFISLGRQAFPRVRTSRDQGPSLKAKSPLHPHPSTRFSEQLVFALKPGTLTWELFPSLGHLMSFLLIIPYCAQSIVLGVSASCWGFRDVGGCLGKETGSPMLVPEAGVFPEGIS